MHNTLSSITFAFALLLQESAQQIPNNTSLLEDSTVGWLSAQTALIVVDMWDTHWCRPAAMRASHLVPRIDTFVRAARKKGAVIIWAPSNVVRRYARSGARRRTLQLPKSELPPPTHAPLFLPNPARRKGPRAPANGADDHILNDAAFLEEIGPPPLNTSTRHGCDDPNSLGPATTHTRQHKGLHIDNGLDYMVTSNRPAGRYELQSVIARHGVRYLLYVGVHANLCLLKGRPWSIAAMRLSGWPRERLAVVSELTDVLYTPEDAPHVDHSTAMRMHMAYIEACCAATVSAHSLLRDVQH